MSKIISQIKFNMTIKLIILGDLPVLRSLGFPPALKLWRFLKVCFPKNKGRRNTGFTFYIFNVSPILFLVLSKISTAWLRI